MELSLIVGASIIAVLLLVRWLRARIGTRKLLEDSASYLRSLALMVDGSFLTIVHEDSGRFIQFLRTQGVGEEDGIYLDFPGSEDNRSVFDGVARALNDGGWTFVKQTESGGSGEFEVLRVFVSGYGEQAVLRAIELIKELLPELIAAEDDRFRFRLEGRRDNDALRRASSGNLRSVASSRIPVLRWLARREIKKLTDD